MFLAQLKLTLREKQAWFWGHLFPCYFNGHLYGHFQLEILTMNFNQKLLLLMNIRMQHLK